MVRVIRGVALAALAAGAAAALASWTSLALFQSNAQSQTDTFTTGTVGLGTLTPAANCDIQAVEPGESGTCQYTVRYVGSQPAWVGLDVQTSSVAGSTYTPPGGDRAASGAVLLGGVSGLTLTLSDSWGNALTVPDCIAAASTPASCSGVLNDQLLAAAGSSVGSPQAGAWSPGTQDTVIVHWALPLAARDGLQGAKAQIRLQAHAVQTADNPLVGGVPREGWQTAPAGADLAAGPAMLRFGAVGIGGGSGGRNLTLTNTGGLPTIPLRLSLAGDPPDFQVAADRCAGQILEPGASCVVTVTFAPEVAGVNTGTLEVRAGALSTLVPLSGTGEGDPPAAAQMTLAAARTTLGSGADPLLVGGGAAAARVTLTVSGAPVRGLVPSLAGPGWTLGADTCPATLAAGARCTLSAVFGPVAAGLVGGLPTYTATAEPATLRVTASGVSASLGLTGTAAWGCTAFAGDGYRGCQLRGADLAETSITGANLSGATLVQADLADTVANGVNLRYADLARADLAVTDLSGADLQGANLQGANLTGVTWNGAICPDGTAADTRGGSCLGDLTP